MTTYRLFHPDHEYLGQLLLDFEIAAGRTHISKAFARHGLTNIDPKGWYPAQKFMDALKDLAEGGEFLDFVAIGIKQAELSPIPPEFYTYSPSQILAHLNESYHGSNRGTDIGEIKAEVVTKKYVRMVLRVPQPDDIWYGVCYGTMKMALRPGTPVKVYYDEDLRRDHGSDVTVIHIRWGENAFEGDAVKERP